MAPRKATRAKEVSGSTDPSGMFDGMVVFLVENGVQSRRLQIWKQKLLQNGATIEDHISKKITHIFSMNSKALLQVGRQCLKCFKGSLLHYQWLEESLKLGEKVSEDSYNLKGEVEEVNKPSKPLDAICCEPFEGNLAYDEIKHSKRAKFSPENSDVT